MNPDFHDDPDFTAYVLGEATLEQSAYVRRQLASSAPAREHYQRIVDTIGALQQMPPPPRRALHPRQRETVLSLGQPVLVSSSLRQPSKKALPFRTLKIVGKLAAAACLTLGAFLVGQKFSSPLSSSFWNQGVAPSQEEDPSIPPGNAALATALSQMPAVTLMEKFRPSAHSLSPFEPPALPEPDVFPLPTVTLAETKPPVLDPVNALALASEVAARSSPPANPLQGFTRTEASSQSRFSFEPNLARRRPSEFAGIILASPAPPVTQPAGNRNKPKAPDAAQPPLMVRFWKAEVASCPWDPQRRLMRLVTQIPIEQPAFEVNEMPYQLQATFDPRQVQGHRLVAEKHLRPGSGRNQATRIVWYELIPGPQFSASNDRPANLGNLKVIQPKNVKNDDIAPLPLLDRGAVWQDAREDFIFETAMVGFGLLLQGRENIGTLNHDLVLHLAEHTNGDDPKGERARFVQSVKQAQRAAGL